MSVPVQSQVDTSTPLPTDEVLLAVDAPVARAVDSVGQMPLVDDHDEWNEEVVDELVDGKGTWADGTYDQPLLTTLVVSRLQSGVASPIDTPTKPKMPMRGCIPLDISEAVAKAFDGSSDDSVNFYVIIV